MTTQTVPADRSLNDDPEFLELAERARERAGSMTEEQAEQLREDELQQARLERSRALIDEICPRQFRRDIELLPAVTRWIEDVWTKDRDELAESKAGLCLVGRPGAGKTHTAWQIVRCFLQRGWDDLAVHSVTELFDEFTRRSQNKRSDKDLIDSLISVDLLVLDDLGAKPLTEFREERLLLVLDGRYRSQLPTIITTNIGAPAFPEHFGARNASRIGGMCRVVLFPNKDWRTGRVYGEKGKQ